MQNYIIYYTTFCILSVYYNCIQCNFVQNHRVARDAVATIKDLELPTANNSQVPQLSALEFSLEDKLELFQLMFAVLLSPMDVTGTPANEALQKFKRLYLAEDFVLSDYESKGAYCLTISANSTKCSNLVEQNECLSEYLNSTDTNIYKSAKFFYDVTTTTLELFCKDRGVDGTVDTELSKKLCEPNAEEQYIKSTKYKLANMDYFDKFIKATNEQMCRQIIAFIDASVESVGCKDEKLARYMKSTFIYHFTLNTEGRIYKKCPELFSK